MNAPERADESLVTHGAQWFTGAFVAVGILNYAYALVLTRLLNVGSYSTFAAGQTLLLWASTVATVSVPWVLAQALVRARTEAERRAATEFAMMASVVSGVIAAVVVGLIAVQLAGPLSTLILAFSTFVIFLGTITMGWLEGHRRIGTLSVLTLGESVLKTAAGLLLVMVAGWQDAGAFAAFGIGALLLLLWWPPMPRGGWPWVTALANRDLWHRAAGIAGIQGMVTLFAAIDVVLVTLLPGSRATVASYQASAALSRVPLFVASAVGTAFFPWLSRHGPSGLAASALRMYAIIALPLTLVLVTMPAPVLAVMFPPQYAAMATLLRFTAIAGLAAGGINVVTTVFQATGDYSCLWWQVAGLAGYLGALLVGWRIGGISGLAVSSALGAAAAFSLLSYHYVRRHGNGLFARLPLAEPLVAAAALVLVRPVPVLWAVAAGGIGLRAAQRFLRRPVAQEGPVRTARAEISGGKP